VLVPERRALTVLEQGARHEAMSPEWLVSECHARANPSKIERGTYGTGSTRQRHDSRWLDRAKRYELALKLQSIKTRLRRWYGR
jgi:hypothetical protein